MCQCVNSHVFVSVCGIDEEKRKKILETRTWKRQNRTWRLKIQRKKSTLDRKIQTIGPPHVTLLLYQIKPCPQRTLTMLLMSFSVLLLLRLLLHKYLGQSTKPRLFPLLSSLHVWIAILSRKILIFFINIFFNHFFILYISNRSSKFFY